MLWIIAIVYILAALLLTVRIMGAGHTPAAAAAWLLAVWLMLPAGALLYMLTAWYSAGEVPRRTDGGESFVESVVSGGCGAEASDGNSVELLNDGCEMFPSLIRELHRARRTIHLEYYIFNDDRIGKAIADVLLRKVRAGVEVRLLYDAVGSWRLSQSLVRYLRENGVEVAAFGRVRFPWFTPTANIRNHRKVAVIDGRTAFIGGINIARKYLDGDELGRWRDEHLRIEGPAVADLQRLFAKDWSHAGGRPFDAASTIAATTSQAGLRMQIGWSQTGTTRRTLADAFTAAIMHAQSEIRISTPYFVPSDSLLRAMCIAAAGGVRVRLMVPARADLRSASLAGESYFGELLAAGAEIYLYDKGFLHSKTMSVDSSMASVGTANLDCRSLFTNWEVAAFVYDRDFASMAAATFERDLQHCRRLDRREYEARTLGRRMSARFWRLFSPLL